MSLFKLLGSLGNLGKIQEEAKLIQAEIAQLQFEGKAGGGLVVVGINGSQQLTRCEIDPKLVSENDKEMIEDLVVGAVNDALTQQRRASAELLQLRLKERLNLPEIPGLMETFFPKS